MGEALPHMYIKHMGTIAQFICGHASAVAPWGQVRQCAHGFSWMTAMLLFMCVVVVVHPGAQVNLKLVARLDKS